MKYLISLLATVLLLSACGFQLRGSAGFHVTSVYLQAEGAGQVAAEVTRILQEKGIKIAAQPSEAEAVVYLRQETFDRRTLSVSATSGKVQEVELNLRVELEIRKADGTVLTAPQTLSLIRDYSFDETAVLAMGAEEETLREELLREIVAQIIRRLQAVQVSKQ